MKIYQVEDECAKVIESVLDSISRCPEGEHVFCFAFGMEYTDRSYSTGYVDATPRDLSDIAGYITMDANLRYMLCNREKYEEEEEE